MNTRDPLLWLISAFGSDHATNSQTLVSLEHWGLPLVPDLPTPGIGFQPRAPKQSDLLGPEAPAFWGPAPGPGGRAPTFWEEAVFTPYDYS